MRRDLGEAATKSPDGLKKGTGEMMEIVPIALTHLVAFLIFIWLLKKFAIGPVSKVLDERREKIAEDFNQIDASQKSVAVLKEEYETRLAEIDEEARKHTIEETNRARRIAEEIAENARAEAAQIIESARANVEIQIDKARVALKDEIVALTLAATERLIRERVDDSRHRQMVGAFIQELEKRN
jgi:F-type H+-transporting ATPase subunit b